MPTIDELGSHAAAQLSDQVRTGTDVEARLAELHASGATVLLSTLISIATLSVLLAYFKA